MAKKGDPKERKSRGANAEREIEKKPFQKVALRLHERYKTEVAPALKEKFQYSNVMQIPRVAKIVINMGVGEAVGNPKMLDAAYKELTMIAGQKPVVTKARVSISNFKLREGVKIGTKVTLRRDRMWAFLDKLFSVVVPRIRDFRGLSNKSFDGRGNYALGLKEQTIFPEIEFDRVDQVRGMDIVIVTTAKTDEEAAEFLRLLGCPMRSATQTSSQ